MSRNQCINCVLDTSAEEITFNEKGVCNYCIQAQRALSEIRKEKPNLHRIIEQIKKDGEGKKYDVLCGLSGGVDSSTALHHVIDLGLRPLCFSMDNGFQSDIANENIMRMVETLKVVFYRYVVDLVKFRELLSAFIKAGVPNIEIPTDHLIMATAYELADQNDIKWIVSGGNVSEESILPKSWGYNARDLVHIKAIYKQFTGKELTDLPMCSLWRWNMYRHDKGIKIWYLLDYL